MSQDQSKKINVVLRDSSKTGEIENIDSSKTIQNSPTESKKITSILSDAKKHLTRKIWILQKQQKISNGME